MPKRPRSIAASLFKEQCLRIMDQVQKTGAEITITKHGRPVARLVPTSEPPVPLFGRLRGCTLHEGDMITPTGEKWEALRG